MTKARPRNHRAVMASRVEPADSDDLFPTWPWALSRETDRLIGANWQGGEG